MAMINDNDNMAMIIMRWYINQGVHDMKSDMHIMKANDVTCWHQVAKDNDDEMPDNGKE